MSFSPINLTTLSTELTSQGFAKLPAVFSAAEVESLRQQVDAVEASQSHSAPGVRRLIEKAPTLLKHLMKLQLRQAIPVVSARASVCKSVLFDKTPDTNWYVTWHQDIPINVAERIETPGFSGWTERDGVISVRPPEAINQQVLTMRIHLDATDADSGALKVIPGSHHKHLNDSELRALVDAGPSHSCAMNAGDVLLMRPLLLHASAKSKQPSRRRVIHLELSEMALPNGLQWDEWHPFA